MGQRSVGGLGNGRWPNIPPLHHSNTPHLALTRLVHSLLAWLRPEMPVRRYRVTPRHNAYAFRRALVRTAMRELKRDPAFASLTGMIPDNNLNRR
jgi:hypothetical protein